MSFTARGIPIHTRSLSVTLRQKGPREVSFEAYVLDLRKRGFVPVAGDLQGTGIIHHMRLDGSIDTETLTIREVDASMPSVAFEATAATGGESCRDRIGRLDHLTGAPLEPKWARFLGTEIGGPLGCSHMLTLAQLLGPTCTWALRREPRLCGGPREEGERIFRRDVTVDGFEVDGSLALLAQHNDMHFRSAAVSSLAADLLAEQIEIRVTSRLQMDDMALREVAIYERRRSASSIDAAAWTERPDRAGPLAGAPLRSGISGLLMRQFGEPGEDQPLLDALLMLAPATVQCMASFRDTWTMLRKVTVAETGGFPDSCYMWRKDGALDRRRSGTG